jgi:hydrogenase nickel incorporation protein HypA/HybF
MHELSIVASVVDTVTESLEALPDASKGARVLEVRLRIGALAGVVVDSLEFCWEIATEGTALEGSRLVVKTVPVVMHCAVCAADVELTGVQSFRCPRCDEPCSDLRQGRELEIESFEIDDEAAMERAGIEAAGEAG